MSPMEKYLKLNSEPSFTLPDDKTVGDILSMSTKHLFDNLVDTPKENDDDGIYLPATISIDNFFDTILGEHHNIFFDYLDKNPLFSDIKSRFLKVSKLKIQGKKNIEKEKKLIKEFFAYVVSDEKGMVGRMFEMLMKDIGKIKEKTRLLKKVKNKNSSILGDELKDEIEEALNDTEEHINKIIHYNNLYKQYVDTDYITILEKIGIKNNVFEKLVDVEELGELVQTLLKNTEDKYLVYDIVFLLIFIRFISTLYFYFIKDVFFYLKENPKKQTILNYEDLDDFFKVEGSLGIGVFEYLDILGVFNKVALNVLNYGSNQTTINTILGPSTEEQRNNIYLTLSGNVKLYEKITNLHNLGLMSKWQEFMEKGGKLKEYLDFVDPNLFKEYPGIINFIDLDKIEKYKNFINRSGLSNKEKAFAIEFGAIEKENDIIKKLLFIYENTELKREQIKKLTDEQIVNIAENYNLPLEFLNTIIEGENINEVKKLAEIKAFKEDILNKLYFIPETSGFNQITNQIKSELEKINIENFDEIKVKIIKLFDNNLKKIYDSIKKLLAKNILSLDEIKKIFNLLDAKKTKNNKLKNNDILKILTYLLENFDKEEVQFIKQLIDKKVITNYFVEDYQAMISYFIKNQNIIENIDNNLTTLKQLYESLQTKITETNVKDVIKTYFPENLEDEIYEYYEINSENFDKLITVAKKLENKQDDNFYLELISLENKEFKIFYFLIKNLSILGINLKDKYNELLELLKNNLFSEKKIKELKGVLKGDILDDIDKNFFYTLFLDYIYEKENIDIFNVLMKPKEEIVNEKIIKNKGLEGLAGINGSEALRKFKKLGYGVKRINGSHYFMRHKETNKPLIFPYHEPIKASTLFGILNRAGIRKEEFLEK